MPAYKICTSRIGPCHMKVALVKTSDRDDVKDEYRGFDVDEVDSDQTELIIEEV